MTTTNNSRTIVASHNKFVLTVVISLIVGLAIGAFVLSFDALHALAIASAIAPSLAWIWPLIIDGFIITATIAIFALRGRGHTWYPWAALVLFALVSVFGNSIHAVNNPDELGVNVWIASSVSAAPAIALLLASHFLVIMISAPRITKVNEIQVESSLDGKILGTAVLDDPFEEPRVKEYNLPQFPPNPEKPSNLITEQNIQPVNITKRIEEQPTVKVEKKVDTPKIVPLVEEPQKSFVETPEQFFNTSSQKSTLVSDTETMKPLIPEFPLSSEPKTSHVVVRKPGTIAVTNEELIEWVKKNNLKVTAIKTGEEFSISERTAQRRLRKLKDLYGDEFENLP